MHIRRNGVQDCLPLIICEPILVRLMMPALERQREFGAAAFTFIQ